MLRFCNIILIRESRGINMMPKLPFHLNKNQVMKHHLFVSLLLLLLGWSPYVMGQGIISQYNDHKGYFGRFGSSARAGQLLIGDDKIQTDKLIITTPGSPPVPSPTLRLNPFNGNVSVGNAISNKGVLNVRSHQESISTRDIQLESNGNIGSEGSLFFQLDDDDNELASFRVKGSDFKNDLLFIGENGVSFFTTDLVIFGEITANNIKSNDIFTIGFSDVEVLGQFGDELFASENGFVYGDNDDIFTSPQLGAAVNLPHQAKITKIEILFKDNISDEGFCAKLLEIDNLAITDSELFSRCTSASFASSSWQKWSNSVDVTINNADKLYFFTFESGSWGDKIHLRQVKIYFTY